MCALNKIAQLAHTRIALGVIDMKKLAKRRIDVSSYHLSVVLV